MTEEDPQIERLTNLTFAFLDADRAGRGFLSNDWIREHVKGYARGGRDATAKLLRRDLALLIRAGVPIETIAAEEGNRYRLQTDDYALPEVSFTLEEATMLGLAGEIGQRGELAAFARSGWTKLAASGATRTLEQIPAFNSFNDLARLSAEQLDTLLVACREHHRISFSYRADRVSEPVLRTMDPWGIVNHRNRLYLVGHDLDRGTHRSFRIFRATDIKELGPATHRQEDRNLQELVEEGLRNQKIMVDALISVPGKGAQVLKDQGEEESPGKWRLVDVDRDWLVRTVTGYAPEVVLLEPAEVREDVRALLIQGGEI
ncbi:hypothetical protein COCCU_07310 [Corynebacterium occultum]|uniref:Uncharacterized protein n=1 Tax=Corynebacterium occultum TaxID=2675219 RepID=A0A6B8W907_9CORY|nr:WYL domain-containing protein [Corynebacterium occultum]QGU07396.1 hypothetical protein COCCU_07310 [Corynebacterium occultum]